MSLLIKALDKAQAEKSQQKKGKTQKGSESKSSQAVELSIAEAGATLIDELPESLPDSTDAKPLDSDQSPALSPTEALLTEAQTKKPVVQPVNSSHRQAANVFAAKQAEQKSNALFIFAGAALAALVAIFAYFYYQSTRVSVPLSQAPVVAESAAPILTPAPQPEPIRSTQVEQTVSTEPLQATPPEPMQEDTSLFGKKQTQPAQKLAATEADVDNANDGDEAEPVVEKANAGMGERAIASASASIQVTQNKPERGVNPLLMQAYQAYEAGQHDRAHGLYKQALAKDRNNVDAMLGLAAIAMHQRRNADAEGWYRKVLALEPQNTYAQSGLLGAQQQNVPTDESQLKSMIAKTPTDANLHMALGNFYAEQNQWTAAQQAYFDAYRLNGSADNAFNLAVSLDQLGKPKLALPYYQQALELAQMQSSNVDVDALQARINAIQ